MKIRIILKVLLILTAAFLLYELFGILIAYARHPEISYETKQKTDISTYYSDTSENSERAGIIEDNAEALLQRVKLIENADKEIILSTFAFHSDESGKIIIGTLLEAAARGVKVRILADGFESITAMERNPYFYAMSSHDNIEIKIYNKANPLKPWKMMGRMHDKYLIADGQIYILGGRNTYNYFLGDFPGHKNYDRDVLVYCEEPKEENSVCQLKEYFEQIWVYKECKKFHDKPGLKKKASVQKAMEDARQCYQNYMSEHEEEIRSKDFVKDTYATEKIALISNPIHTQAKEPVVWYRLTEIMKGAGQKVCIHTPYIICNKMMYDSWKDIAGKVPEFYIMTNSVANNGNPFGSADYAKNKDKILETGIQVLEYEGGYSYHGKSILIDDNISIIGSFNMDMRSTYLDTELMLFIRSKEVNQKLSANMQEYEQKALMALKNGDYVNSYNVTPVELTDKRKMRIFLVQHLLGWARFLF